jgi:tRNA pseudouridine32 synthase/23S rRNA pseudouridine746 synthase
VHLKELGHPILGDRLYAPAEIIKQADRLLLHAQRLEIKHPDTEEVIVFEKECEF